MRATDIKRIERAKDHIQRAEEYINKALVGIWNNGTEYMDNGISTYAVFNREAKDIQAERQQLEILIKRIKEL